MDAAAGAVAARPARRRVRRTSGSPRGRSTRRSPADDPTSAAGSCWPAATRCGARRAAAVTLAGMGAVMPELLAAADALGDDTDVICVTSADLLLRACARARASAITRRRSSTSCSRAGGPRRWSPCSTATRTRWPSWRPSTGCRSRRSASPASASRATSTTSTATTRSTPRRSSARRSTWWTTFAGHVEEGLDDRGVERAARSGADHLDAPVPRPGLRVVALARDRVEDVRHGGDAREQRSSPTSRSDSPTRPSARGGAHHVLGMVRDRVVAEELQAEQRGCCIMRSHSAGVSGPRLWTRLGVARACRCPGGTAPCRAPPATPGAPASADEQPDDGGVDRMLDVVLRPSAAQATTLSSPSMTSSDDPAGDIRQLVEDLVRQQRARHHGSLVEGSAERGARERAS